MAKGAIASSGAWVPTLAVYQQTPKNHQKPQHRKVRVLGTQSLAVCNCEMLGSSSLAVHLMPQGGGGRNNEVHIREGEDVAAPASARSGPPKKRERHAGAAWQLGGAVRSQTPGARGYSGAALAQWQEGCGP